MKRLIAIVGVVLVGLALVVPAVAQDTTTLLSAFLVNLRNGTVTASTAFFAGDGTVAAPSIAFTAQTGTGFFRPGSNQIDVALSGVSYLHLNGNVGLPSQASLAWSATSDPTASQDVNITRAGAGAVKVAHATATSTGELQVSGGSGSVLSAVKALTELTTILAAASTPTAIQIPANAVTLAVTVRVVTVIPTAATFTVTSATPAKTWNTVAVPVAANTTDPGTAPGPTFQTTASVITITPNLSPGAATGQVRVTIYYYQVTPATS